MSRISLIKAKSSHKGTLKVLEPFKKEFVNRVRNLEEIVVKINFVTTECELATTPFDAVCAFIDFIKPFYKGKIVIAEEATIGSTEAGFRRYGFEELAKDDPQVAVFNSAKSVPKKVIIGQKNGKVSFSLAKIYIDNPFVVSIARAKTHDTVVVTLSIKNLIVGAIQQKLFARRGGIHQGKQIHRIMAELAKYTFPDFAIIDGVIGMQGNGPVSGDPINSGWITAGFDALAVDSLSAYLMGFKNEDIGYFNLMKEAGLGDMYGEDEIEIVGEDPSELIKPFKPHASFEEQRKWR